jgi:hypothetical protein
MKNRRQQKYVKTISSSSPIFALSNYTTFGQTQTGATVPLNTDLKETALDTTGMKN